MDDSLQPVIDYLEELDNEAMTEGGVAPDIGLSTDKVVFRAKLVEDDEYPDWIAFEVERHEGLFESYWAEGEAMNAFVTCFPRFAFKPRTKALHRIKTASPPVISEGAYSVLGTTLDMHLEVEVFERDLKGVRYEFAASLARDAWEEMEEEGEVGE